MGLCWMGETRLGFYKCISGWVLFTSAPVLMENFGINIPART